MRRCCTRSRKADLADKLQALLDDEALRRQWAARAKQRADELFRWEVIAEKYETLFEEVVHSGIAE